MTVRSLLKTFRVAWGIKVFRRLGVVVARSEVPDAAHQLKARAQRIKRQKRKLERQKWELERQKRKLERQNQQIEHLQKNRHIEAKNRQIEHLQKKLAEANPQEALWERGKDYATWEAAKHLSIEFWRERLKMLASGGLEGQRLEAYTRRLDPENPLKQYISEYLDSPPGSEVSILDVGAGPLTNIGTRWEGRAVSITAVDVLAESYNYLLAEFGITPPVRTESGEVEQLTELFPPNHFDLVHIANALDHSYDPLRGIQQMLEVVKPGHYVLLLHKVNEAENANYEAFHQWNFCAEEGRFIIWNRQTRLCVNEALGDTAEVTIDSGLLQNNRIFVSLKKAW
jgi:SAM-dependent methyltransferase